jgi:hypothetical protein
MKKIPHTFFRPIAHVEPNEQHRIVDASIQERKPAGATRRPIAWQETYPVNKRTNYEAQE